MGLVGVTPSIGRILSGRCFKALEDVYGVVDAATPTARDPLTTSVVALGAACCLCWGWLEQRCHLLNIRCGGVSTLDPCCGRASPCLTKLLDTGMACLMCCSLLYGKFWLAGWLAGFRGCQLYAHAVAHAVLWRSRSEVDVMELACRFWPFQSSSNDTCFLICARG
jgi:hypothetical protein